MKYQRRLTNALGESYLVELEIREDGAAFERALMHLANKARASSTGTATMGGGLIVVRVEKTDPRQLGLFQTKERT